jgi:gluconolactonase
MRKATKAIAPIATALALGLSAPAVAQDLEPGESAVDIAGIPGVIAGDAQWETVWTGPMTADGMSTTPDGHVIFAQEQSNAIWKLWPDGRSFVELPYVTGAGATSVTANGRILAVERGCTDPGLMSLTCDRATRVMQLTPERVVIADAQADGASLGRLNDLTSDGRGGAWFTQGNLWHTDVEGNVTTTYEANVFTNGVVTSPDGDTLYVTDRTDVVALDIGEDGSTSNARVFATLSRDTQGFGGDGMAVDGDGRLYVTGDAGVYVFADDGTELGVIPAPRRTITVTLAGPERNMLYVGAMGASTPAGVAWETPEGIRNVAMTIYRVPLLVSGE